MKTPEASDTSKQADRNSDLVGVSSGRGRRWRPIMVIGCVLMAWACFLGVGAILASDDYLKALVIVGVMACFISLWMVALWLKK